MDPLEAAQAVCRGDELLTLRDAAAAVGVSKKVVERWVQRDLLRAAMVDGVRVVLHSEVVHVEHTTRTGGRGRPRRDTWAC